jgi:dimethylargininase
MLHALVREVSPTIVDCQLTHLPRQAIDFQRARQQHAAYTDLLAELGVRPVHLPPLPHCPDAVFVEDTCLVLDEVAVILPMGCIARRAELEGLAPVLSRYRPVVSLDPSGSLDGGDVLRVGRTLYVGLSARTDLAGCELLRRAVAPHGYRTVAVPVTGCLHLKSACSCLGSETLLVNRAWVDPAALPPLNVIDTAPEEPRAANTLRVGDALVCADGFPRTLERLRRQGFEPRTIDVSELQKAEAGLTCTSVLFQA